MIVDLTEEEWVRLLNCAALAPYAQVQPLIVKVMQQLQKAKEANDGRLSEQRVSE